MACKNLCVNVIKSSRILDRRLRIAVAKRGYSKAASAPSKDDEGSTHFGFETVKESEKAEKGRVFVTSLECTFVFLVLLFFVRAAKQMESNVYRKL